MKIGLIFAAMLVAVPAAASTDITGQSANAVLGRGGGGIDSPFVSPQTVGPGVEFNGGYVDSFGQNWQFGLDMFGSGFFLQIGETTNNGNGNLLSGLGSALNIGIDGLSGIGPVTLANYACASPGGSCSAFGGGPSLTALTSDASSAFLNLNIIRSGETYIFSLVDTADVSGQSVSAVLGRAGGGIDSPFVSPQTVGPGVEFNGGYVDSFGQNWQFGLDMFGSGFALRIGETTNNGNGNLLSGLGSALNIGIDGLSGIGPVWLANYACASPGGSCSAFGGGPSLTALTSDASSVFFNLNILRSGETYIFFFGPSAAVIPEPATWAMLIAGFGLVGATMRRRRKCLVQPMPSARLTSRQSTSL